MSQTPVLGLPVMESGQAQKHVSFNEAMAIIDERWDSQDIDEDLDLSASLTTTFQFPQYAIIEAVNGRVIDAVTGCPSFRVGDGGDGAGVAASATRYATGVGVSLNSSFNGVVAPFPVYGPVTVSISPTSGSITGGVIRFRFHYRLHSVPSVV